MKQLSIFIAVCLFTACASQNEIPKNVIGIDTMKTIIWDMAHADALAQAQFKKDTGTVKAKTISLYQQVFRIHGIDKEIFYSSYRYYQEHPDKNKILMDSLTSYAGRKRSDLYKKME